jgi:hypothetical protein
VEKGLKSKLSNEHRLQEGFMHKWNSVLQAICLIIDLNCTSDKTL